MKHIKEYLIGKQFKVNSNVDNTIYTIEYIDGDNYHITWNKGETDINTKTVIKQFDIENWVIYRLNEIIDKI